MKLALASCFLVASASAFQTVRVARPSASACSMGTPGMDMSGNAWKPQSEKMGSTDTGDYFPEGYDRNSEIAFTEGMGGSQAMLGGGNRGVEMPGLDFGDAGYTVGGIEVSSEIPAGMQFVPSSVPDGELVMEVGAASTGKTMPLAVAPFCMGFEDYFAAFSPDSAGGFSVLPATGRMDRRGGEKTVLNVSFAPNGRSGEFVGNLVINLPEDNSKLSYRIIAKAR